MNNVILELKDINKSFGPVHVLEDIGLTLKKGSVLGICGENGAGKSTLMNILGGIYMRDGGKMYIDGAEYDPHDPVDARNKGIAFIHQELSLFENLSVRENMFIDELPRKAGLFVDKRRMARQAKEALAALGLDINIEKPVSEYSMGIRQMVEIGKALLRDVRILIFDEPTTSLSNNEKEKLFQVIRKLQSDGVSILYISHILDDVFMLCDEIMVIRDGHVIDQRPSGELKVSDVVRMMVGRELTNLYPYAEKQIGEEVLHVEGLTSGRTFSDITFSVNEGEIVGMFGLIGAGRSEMARGLFGVDKVDNGHVTVAGQPLKGNPIDSISKGLAFVTESRKEDGLLLNKSVIDNLSLASLDHLKGNLSMIQRDREKANADDMIKTLSIKTHRPQEQQVGQLSGGNQQKVVIGKWLINRPKLFILDEPTRGVDVGAKFEIYTKINDLAAGRSGVLIISSEIEELMGICDRILVMSAGQITGELPRNQFNQDRIMEYAIERG